MTPEGKVKAAIKRFFSTVPKDDLWYFMPVSGGYGRHGIPDFIGCWRGGFFAIECKAGKGKTTALQEKTLMSIMNAQGETYLVNEDNLELFISEWEKRL